MISNLNLRLATLALASSFMAFTASAQSPSDVTVTFSNDTTCSNTTYPYEKNLDSDPCDGSCMFLPADTFISISISDQLNESTCYFWPNGNCSGPYKDYAKAGCTITEIPVTQTLDGLNQFDLSARCYRGACN
jgi:hypothetical protein